MPIRPISLDDRSFRTNFGSFAQKNPANRCVATPPAARGTRYRAQFRHIAAAL